MSRADISGEVLSRVVGVHLVWSDPAHFAPQDKRPCRHGDGPTVMRDDAGDPCHIRCAEKELAAAIAAERFGTAEQVAVELIRRPAPATTRGDLR